MAEQDQAKEKQLAISKIYIKDSSFESPLAPLVFKRNEWNPQTNLNLRSSHNAIEGNVHEIVLTITVEAMHISGCGRSRCRRRPSGSVR